MTVLDDNCEPNQIGTLSHAWYRNVSPGFVEPISGNKSVNGLFPAKFDSLVFYSFFIDFELRNPTINRYCQFSDRLVDVVDLK